MKIDRRSFLSLGVGAAAGTALTPLPWKITDDLSIWTQMWPWTPVPEDGEVTYVNSISTLCPSGCGVSVRKVDDRAIKIEGMPGFPGSDGKACINCMTGLQLLYGPTAVKSPMKRVGERGEGKWKAISWDEAIAEVAQELNKLRKTTPQGLASITGKADGTVAKLFERFLTAFGSPNAMHTASYLDNYALTLKLMHGLDARPGFDLENADFVLSFGSGLIDGWGASARMFKAKSQWKENKAKVVQAEPRLSNTAAKADHWLPVKPGSEGLLALAMAHTIIKESLYNKAFVEKHSFGFDDFKGDDGKIQKGFKTLVLDNFSPSDVSDAVGIDASTIVALAKSFAGAKHPLALCGRGKGITPGSLHDYLAVHALNALVGNLNQKGGVWAMTDVDYVNWPAPKLDETAQKGLATPRIDGAGKEYPLAKSLLTRLPGVINSGGDSPVRALLVSGANPCYTLPDAAAARKALGAIPFIVSFTSHMDETAEMADIILPNHCHLSRYEDVPAPAGMNKPMIGLATPVVAPKYDSKNVGDSILLIAKAMGGTIAESFSWDSYEACLTETLGDKWKVLTASNFVIDEAFQPDGWDNAFHTPSKKFTFLSGACKFDGDKIAGNIEGSESKYPLVLIPMDSMRLAAGPLGNTPHMTKTVSDTVLLGKDSFVEINPKTGGKLGLEDGVKATLATPKGSVTVRVHFSNGMMPGVLAMARGLGHSGIDEYLAGKGANVNELIGPMEDPISGLDAAWGIRAKLTIA